MLTEKQEKKFIDFYRGLYGDTSKATGTGELPKIPKSKEEEHIKLWKDTLTKIIGPRKAESIYKIRPYGAQTILDYVFSRLWFGYGPMVIEDNSPENGEDVKYLKLDDIENEHRKTTK